MNVRKALLHSSLILLGACTPVNHNTITVTYNITTPAPQREVDPPPPPVVVTTTSDSLTSRCPRDKVARLAPLVMPDLPNFQGVNLKNPGEVEDTLIKNLDDVRKALLEHDRKLRKSFADELDRCLGRAVLPMPLK